jgi:hypothetical protein
MELVVEHSLQQQKASLEKKVEGRDDIEKELSPLDKVSSDRRRRSSQSGEKEGASRTYEICICVPIRVIFEVVLVRVRSESVRIIPQQILFLRIE